MNEVIHTGSIIQISNNEAVVLLDDKFECSGCQLEKSCGSTEMKPKEITVSLLDNSYKVNDQIVLVLGENLGLKAVLLAYILPFVIFFTIIVLFQNKLTELLTGVLALIFILLYFLILKKVQPWLSRVFSIEVRKYDKK